MDAVCLETSPISAEKTAEVFLGVHPKVESFLFPEVWHAHGKDLRLPRNNRFPCAMTEKKS